MRKTKFILLALMCIALFSCKKDDPEYRVGDLQALWLENGTQNYVRFTDEQTDKTDYFWGREWDLAKDITEEDLYNEDDFHGNGWFKYQLEKKGDLHEIHMMSNSGAVIPKEYIVSKLTSSALELYEKDNKNHKFYFTKQ
jgi:hypothetical protein